MDDDEVEEVITFCRDVINFSMVHFGLLTRFRRRSRLFQDSIGKAVVSLQVINRNELKTCFFTSIGIIAEVVQEEVAMRNISTFLGWSYFQGEGSDIFNLIFANLAAIIELFLFLQTVDLTLSDDWFHCLWLNIYKYKIKDNFIKDGGWLELAERAKTRYEASGIYGEMVEIIQSDLRHPYGAIGGLDQLDDSILRLGFDPREVIRSNRTLHAMKVTEFSIRVMNCLYNNELLPGNVLDTVIGTLAGGIKIGENLNQPMLPAPEPVERLI